MPRKRTTVPTVAFSNLEKIFFPATGFTKGDLIKYYIEIAPVLLPHFVDRPVTLIRMPDGVGGQRFYEKNAPGHTPDWVQRTRVPRSEGGSINYVMVNDAPTLAWCANNAAVELHPFLHRAGALQQPTHAAFDLDPGDGADLLTCIEVAFLIRAFLEPLQLEAFPKVSGSKGLQLYVPLNTGATYETVTPFAKSIAELLQQQQSDLIVSEMSKSLRVNRVFIDWSQNHEKKTTVGPYSVRGKREAPFVSLPVTWEELKRVQRSGDLDALFFAPDTALRRVKQHGDLFAPVLRLKQRLPATLPRGGGKRSPSSLHRYASKRDFAKTAEPPPLATRSAQGSRRRFVIQKHAASHLHYDLRLEMDGVLKSWAVPKGLATEPGIKRSAFQTEDHPLEYFSFEGTIPAGEYGGGTVMVWDLGTYDVIGGNYWKGDLKLWLSGQKLSGEWHLFKIKSEDEAKPVWLVQKAAGPARPVTAKQENTSALSGRTMAQIAQARDAVWKSHRASRDPGKRGRSGTDTKRTAAAPRFVEPMAAREVPALPDDDTWVYEIKWDGYRGLGVKHGDDVRLLSRKNKDLGSDFPGVLDALRTLDVETVLIDGEIVGLDAAGKPSLQLLQNPRAAEGAIVYYAFDLLTLNGEDWRARPFAERKAKLAELVAGSAVRLSPSFDGPADKVLAAITELGLEGIVAKRRDSPYRSGRRSGAWVKLKLSPEQEFVIGG